MENLTALFTTIWKAPIGKQFIAFLMAIPIATAFFFQYYYNNIVLSEKELREGNVELSIMFINSEKDCARRLFLLDSVHVAKALKRQEEQEARDHEFIRQLREDLREAQKANNKSREITNEIKETITIK